MPTTYQNYFTKRPQPNHRYISDIEIHKFKKNKQTIHPRHNFKMTPTVNNPNRRRSNTFAVQTMNFLTIPMRNLDRVVIPRKCGGSNGDKQEDSNSRERTIVVIVG